MARLLVQSLATGRFLCPSLEDGQPEWVVSLREAGGGVVSDLDAAFQLVQDHCDPEDLPTCVDLDRLGTFNDYPVSPAPDVHAARGAGGSDVAARLFSIPDGNHGDNDFSTGSRP